MPNYEYLCKDCGGKFTTFQTIVAKKLTTCIKCGGKLIRLIGPGSGVIFKGSWPGKDIANGKT